MLVVSVVMASSILRRHETRLLRRILRSIFLTMGMEKEDFAVVTNSKVVE